MERIIITEGVTLNVVKTDKFKTGYLSFNFITPLKKETASLYSLVPQVLMRGTRKHKDTASLKIALDDLYAASVEERVFRRGENQICGLNASWISDKYSIDGTEVTQGTLDIINELLFDPYTENGVFSLGYVETEKRNHIDDIKAIINNKNGYAVRRCQDEMCKDEPFGIWEYGDIESVSAITPEGLFEAYKEWLSTARIEIFYVGDYDVDLLSGRIKKMFEQASRNYTKQQKTLVIKDVKEVKEITEKCAASQGKLSLGFRLGCAVGEEGYRAFPLFVEMYANSPVSKLFMNVRERLSLCYYCRAIPDGIKGIMVVTSGIEVSDKEKAQNEILAQLDNVRQGKITDEEIGLAKKSLKNAYNEIYDNPASLEGWYLTRILSEQYKDPDVVCEEILSVTKEDIIKAANNVKLDTVYFLEGTLKGEKEDADE